MLQWISSIVYGNEFMSIAVMVWALRPDGNEVVFNVGNPNRDVMPQRLIRMVKKGQSMG